MIFLKMARNRSCRASAFFFKRLCPVWAPFKRAFIPDWALFQMQVFSRLYLLLSIKDWCRCKLTLEMGKLGSYPFLTWLLTWSLVLSWSAQSQLTIKLKNSSSPPCDPQEVTWRAWLDYLVADKSHLAVAPRSHFESDTSKAQKFHLNCEPNNFFWNFWK